MQADCLNIAFEFIVYDRRMTRKVNYLLELFRRMDAEDRHSVVILCKEANGEGDIAEDAPVERLHRNATHVPLGAERDKGRRGSRVNHVEGKLDALVQAAFYRFLRKRQILGDKPEVVIFF